MGGIPMGIMGGNFVFYIEVPGGACFEQGNPRIREPQAAACNIILYHGTYYVSESITWSKVYGVLAGCHPWPSPPCSSHGCHGGPSSLEVFCIGFVFVKVTNQNYFDGP